MNDPGVHNPRRNMLICLGISLAAFLSIAGGVLIMQRTGGETTAWAAMIGLAMLPAIFGPLMALNFWRGMKMFAAIRRGDAEIARWRVTADELAACAPIDAARNAHGGVYRNVWSPPRIVPPAGIEIIFAEDAVLVGNSYYALVNTGMFRFTSVGTLTEGPPTIEFSTIFTVARGGSTMSMQSVEGALRLPVSRHAGAEAARVLNHFQRVARREIVVNPDFYPGRRRIAMIAAPACFAVAALGYWLDGDALHVRATMIAGGIMFGIAMLIAVMLASWGMRAQRRRG